MRRIFAAIRAKRRIIAIFARRRHVRAAKPDEPAAGHPPDSRLVALAAEAVAARGKPPAPPAGQPAELAHEAVPAGRPDPTPRASAAQVEADGPGRPAADAEPGTTQQKGPGTAGPSARFERVRSTPTPPGG